jgi:hypothetical protein
MQRDKILMAWGADSDCLPVPAESKYAWVDRVAWGLATRFDGIESC